MSVANQKLITLDRIRVDMKQTGRQYLAVYRDNLFQVYQILEGKKSFGIYLYLLSQKPHYYNGKREPNNNSYFELSPIAIKEELGISKTTYLTAVKELEELGFLENTKGNTYRFYELPQRYKAKSYEKFKEDRIITIDEQEKYLKEKYEEELRANVREEMREKEKTISEEIKNTPIPEPRNRQELIEQSGNPFCRYTYQELDKKLRFATEEEKQQIQEAMMLVGLYEADWN